MGKYLQYINLIKDWYPAYIKYYYSSVRSRPMPFFKWAKIWRHFTKEVTQMADTHVKRCSTSLVTRKTQFETTARSTTHQSEWLKFKSWQYQVLTEVWSNRCWCKCTTAQSFWEIESFLESLTHPYLPFNLVIPLLGVYLRKMKIDVQRLHWNVHSSLICNSQKLEINQRPNNKWTGYMICGISVGNKKAWTIDTHDDRDGPQKFITPSEISQTQKLCIVEFHWYKALKNAI